MIIIHAKGNSKIGIGNLSRCCELINYLSRKHKTIGIFECDNKLYSRYEQKNIFQSNSSENSLNIIEKFNEFYYICDLIDPNKKLSTKIKSLGAKKIFYFNGLENGFEPDILFLTNGFDYAFEKKNFDLYRGFEYYIVGNDIIKNRPTSHIKKDKIKDVLICFGGADPAYFTENIVQVINDIQYNYTVVLGPAMNQERKEFIKGIKKDNVKYVDSPNNMMELYSNTDLLITLGGMMTYEAMCLGIPVCAIKWPYLEFVVINFAKKDMITNLGNINEAYKNLLELDIRNINNISKNAFNIIDGSALKNIQTIIEKYL